MRILYVTTIGMTMMFFKSFVKSLVDNGHTVDIATNDSQSKVDSFYNDIGCEITHIDCSRSPLSRKNIAAVKQIKKLAEERNYDIVHCHTPVAAMCTRLACIKARKQGTKVFYTAHGFHFYKGAPIKNWLLFYPVEWLCSFMTDTLITINTEDYSRAKRHMHAKKVEYVPGVGIDLKKFSNVQADRASKRKELGIPENAFLALSVGELNENKNHQIVLHALAKLNNPDIHYAIAGDGEKYSYLQDLAKKLGLENNFHLLGYREDAIALYKSADIYVLPSVREGLNVSVMEAMASGLPCVVSKIRGNVDMVDDCNGLSFEPTNVQQLAEHINFLYNKSEKCNELGKESKNKVLKFDVCSVNKAMNEIYSIDC